MAGTRMPLGRKRRLKGKGFPGLAWTGTHHAPRAGAGQLLAGWGSGLADPGFLPLQWDPRIPQVRRSFPGIEVWSTGYGAPQQVRERLPIYVSPRQTPSISLPGEMLSLGVGILVGCLCLLLAVYFIARKIR